MKAKSCAAIRILTRPIIVLYLVIAIICNNIYAVQAKPKGVTEIDEIRAHYIGLEKALWNYLNERSDKDAKLKKVYENHRNFINANLRNKFDEGKHFVLNRYYEWSLLEKELQSIDGLFTFFITFLEKYKNGNYDERAVTDLSETIFKDDEFSIPNIFNVIDNVMIKQTLYYRAIMDAKEQICATKQSAQQYLYSLYNDISLTELKGYTMMQFSWMILSIYDKENNFSNEANLMRNEFNTRTNSTQTLLRQVMKRADRIVWRCDPIRHVKGVTYDEVTRLLQGYIENEVDMNPDNTCRENCDYYSIAKNHGCFKDLYCARQPRCSGKLLNCQYFDSDMWICPASPSDTRRYQYIEFENGRVLGQKESCSRGTTKVDSWWRWLFWHCSYCFCLCDEAGLKSDRYFNLRESVSNITANKVITGLRFRKHKRVFHLQIQEGELLPRGNINLSSLSWKSVDDYQIFDRGVISGKDYHTLSWNERAIDLDDITGNLTYVITGVRFRVLGAHLNLEARLTEFDFETGKLIDKNQSFWKSNDNTDISGEKRDEIILRNPDVSSRSFIKSIPTSRHNQYIEFVNSDIDKDAAQSTVPFVDIQDVISEPPVPLSGIGIYHKGRDQFGGFIAPKLITYDFTLHIQSPLQENGSN